MLGLVRKTKTVRPSIRIIVVKLRQIETIAADATNIFSSDARGKNASSNNSACVSGIAEEEKSCPRNASTKPRGDKTGDTQFRRRDKAMSFTPQTASRERDAGQLSERRIVVGGIIIVSARAACLRLSCMKTRRCYIRKKRRRRSLGENRKLKSVI